jgi:hypothetical protein
MKEKWVRPITLLLVAFFLANFPTRATASEETKGRIINFGLIEPITKERREDSPETTAGIRRIARWKVTKRTGKIPARIGLQFGIEFFVTGLPSNSVVILRKTVNHPMITKPDGKASKGYTRHMPILTTKDGTIRRVEGYGFDHEYELVPGEWTIEFWFKNHKLAGKTFQVYLGE